MDSSRRTLLLGAAAVVALAALAWSWFGAPGSEPVAASSPAAGGRAAASEVLPQAEAVRLDALSAQRTAPGDAVRNPFRFGRAPAAAAVGTPARPADEPSTPVFEPAKALAPTGPPPPPPITLKFIGLVTKADGTKLAVLSAGEGQMPLHGKEGDIIDGRYRIMSIGLESVDVAYLDGRGRQTIKLTGQ